MSQRHRRPLWQGELPREQVMAEDSELGAVILVKDGSTVQAWRNSCPHVGVALDYGDGNCLLEPGVLICSMHGALFDASSGLCTDGPCRGDSLTAVPILIHSQGIDVLCADP
ncbi:MAG: Rieske (2Fe-2S) protein [Planctomycetota bacterium]|nr:MAG: Rieske (2Fe-2S) protein [Planctomycetota bacterium]